ncbi:MAG TPA: MFS transporter [Vicinamibacterales bacterium]|nr:MFS transporter [Vicinamibacterales bacterium]
MSAPPKGGPPVSIDPRDVIATAPMSRLQIIVIGITIALNALDGYDILSISFASNGIAREWGLDSQAAAGALGIVLSMELIGMMIGSIALGGVSDKIGRRPTTLGCLVVMALGMFMATTATSPVTLSIWRVVTGLGIGGMLASMNAVAAEFSNTRRRNLSVSLMSIGYPLGATFGGMVAAQLLKTQDWRSVFYFGASVTAVLIPIVFFVVPESIHWLARKQPTGALEKINRALARMGHAAVNALPDIGGDAHRGWSGIFGPAMIAITAIVTVAYFFHITTFYFIMKWVPKIVADFGFPASSAAGVVVWANAGGATGGTVFGLLAMRFGLKPLTIIVMVLSTVMVTMFGQSPHVLQTLSLICFGAGFCTNAAIVGMYAIIAQAFPTQQRASGTGFAVGVGRGGSVLAPIIAGFLFQAGYALPTVAFLMALGSLVAAGVLMMLKLEGDGAVTERAKQVVATRVPATQ